MKKILISSKRSLPWLVCGTLLLPLPLRAEELTLTLASGWNLLNSPLQAEEATVTAVLAPLLADTTSVWKWAANTWAVLLPTEADGGKAYAAAKGFSPLLTLNSGEGFWLLMAQPHELTLGGQYPGDPALALPPGWNLVGLKGQAAAAVADIVAAQGGEIVSLWGWTGASWAVSLPGMADLGEQYAISKGFTQLTTIHPLQGFWVNVAPASATTTTTTTVPTTTTTTTLPPPPKECAIGPKSGDGQLDMVRALGNQLVVGPDNHEVRLRGINFENIVWEFEVDGLENHHGQEAFAEVKAAGLNAVRFMLSAAAFEDPADPTQFRQEAWQWLDHNVEWACQQDLYLLLDMQGYPGMVDGAEVQPIFDHTDLALRDSLRLRLKNLWQAIAQRYQHEPTVVGYDLLNEPVTTESGDWPLLAQEVATAIRAKDAHHLLVVEHTERLAGLSWGEGDYVPDKLFFTLDDNNYMVDFHFYAPLFYTHQYLFGSGMGEGGAYPDPAHTGLDMPGTAAGRSDNPWTPAGESAWTLYQGVPFVVDDPGITHAFPFFECGANSGTVAFDDFEVYELACADAPAAAAKRLLFADPVVINEVYATGALPHTDDPFPAIAQYWLPAPAAGETASHGLASQGHLGPSAIMVTGVKGAYELRNEALRLQVRQGCGYRLDAWLRGEAVSGQGCRMGLEFRTFGSGEGLPAFDKAFVEAELDIWAAAAKKLAVPVNVGEFGTARLTFAGDRGGDRWLLDVAELLETRGFNYFVFGYHSPEFGLYPGAVIDPINPAARNEALWSTLQEMVTTKGASPQ